MTTPNNRPARRLIALSVLAFAATACAPNGENRGASAVDSDVAVVDDGSTASDRVETVTIERSRFGVRELRVEPGTTVVWRNDDEFAHTVTSTDDSPVDFDSGEFAGGATFEMTFDEPGEYRYFCQIHPTMRAVVIVG